MKTHIFPKIKFDGYREVAIFSRSELFNLITTLSYVLKGAYWISSNSSFIQYCYRNIGLFSIAPPLVIALKSESEE